MLITASIYCGAGGESNHKIHDEGKPVLMK